MTGNRGQVMSPYPPGLIVILAVILVVLLVAWFAPGGHGPSGPNVGTAAPNGTATPAPTPTVGSPVTGHGAADVRVNFSVECQTTRCYEAFGPTVPWLVLQEPAADSWVDVVNVTVPDRGVTVALDADSRYRVVLVGLSGRHVLGSTTFSETKHTVLVPYPCCVDDFTTPGGTNGN